MGYPLCNNTMLMPTPNASKCLEKTGKAKMGALVSKNFIIWKAFSCFSPQYNVTSFFTNSLRGEARLEMLVTNLL